VPIVTLQRGMRELGRIRIGNQVAAGKGRRPNKLETFRLTSKARELLEAAAGAYGGTVTPWEDQFELVTSAKVLDIAVPPFQALSQWFELWSGGGCQRRCDGEREYLTDSPCLCAAQFGDDQTARNAAAGKGEACKPTTRLSVILPVLPDLGVWRLETHGFYAAVELAGAASVLETATRAGVIIPARLRLEEREVKRVGEPTKRFAVPVIEFVQTRIGDLVAELAPGAAPASLPSGVNPARLTAGRPELPTTDVPPVAQLRAPAPATTKPAKTAPAAEKQAATPEPVERTPTPAAEEAAYTAVWADEAVVDDNPPIVGLSGAAFQALIRQHELPTAEVAAVGRRLFPTSGGLASLTDAQRATFWAELEKGIAAK
jgi:hypothetical protein